MKLAYNHEIFDFYENLSIEKRIVDTLFAYIGQFNYQEIISDEKIFALIKRDIDNLGFNTDLQLDFFTNNKIHF